APARARRGAAARALRAAERARRPLRGIGLAAASAPQVDDAHLHERPARDLRGLDGGAGPGANRAPGAGAPRRASLLRARRAGAAALHRGQPLLRRPGVARLPGRRAPALMRALRGARPAAARALLALLAALAAAAPPGSAAAQEPAAQPLARAGQAPVELEGTWYVLVHYQDADAHDPQAWRWEDRVWRFAREGDRLVWT